MLPWGQLWRFGITGALSAATHVAVALACVNFLDMNAQLSNTLGFCSSIAVSWSFNHYWSFQGHQRMPGSTMLRYLGQIGVGFLYNLAVVWLLHDKLVVEYT